MRLAYVIKQWHGEGVKRLELHKAVRYRRWLIFRRCRLELVSTHKSESEAKDALKAVAAGWYTETDYDAQGREICYGW